jgi:hypothetical protein
MMKKLLAFFLFLNLSNSIAQTKINYNILFVTDLSNRVKASTELHLSDKLILDSVLSLFYPKIHRNYFRNTGQKDVFRFVFTNNNLSRLYSFPLSKSIISFEPYTIKNSSDKNVFLGNVIPRNNNCAFETSKKFISKKFDSVYKVIQNSGPCYGADIFGFFDRLDEPILKRRNQDRYINYIIILTDGYLENTGGVNNNPTSPDLSSVKLRRFRDYFNKNSKGQNVEQFFNVQNQFGITPLRNNALKNADIRILVMQIDDRSSTNGKICINDPCDDILIKLFWKKWLVSSGINNENIIIKTKNELTNTTDLSNTLYSFFSLKK